MSDRVLKVGLVGAVHPNMPGDDTGLYARIVKEMQLLQDEMDFELAVLDRVLRTEEDSVRAVRFFREEAVDLTLFFCASLPYGRTILPFAGLDTALGIWAVPEPSSGGVLQLNSFCGLNMLGSIMRNYFPERPVRYKWFYGYPGDALFRDRFELTLKALRAVKVLRSTRIAQVGDLADGFENLYVDERKLSARFGTAVSYRHSVEDIVRRAESYREEEVTAVVEEISGDGRRVSPSVSGTDMRKFARIDRALQDFARENRFDCLAISCWSKFQEVYDIAVCGALSRLNDSGIVASCEADVCSAVTMTVLNALNDGKSALNDMVALDESDNSLNLWHCGVAAGCWADSRGIEWDTHFNIGRHEGQVWHGSGVVADLRFKPGEVTIAAMDTDFTSMLVISGSVMKGKRGFNGSSGWVNGLQLNGEDVTIPDLINTIVTGRVNHHYPTAEGCLRSELNEFAFWTDMRLLGKAPYAPYMMPFLADPVR